MHRGMREEHDQHAETQPFVDADAREPGSPRPGKPANTASTAKLPIHTASPHLPHDQLGCTTRPRAQAPSQVQARVGRLVTARGQRVPRMTLGRGADASGTSSRGRRQAQARRRKPCGTTPTRTRRPGRESASIGHPVAGSTAAPATDTHAPASRKATSVTSSFSWMASSSDKEGARSRAPSSVPASAVMINRQAAGAGAGRSRARADHAQHDAELDRRRPIHHALVGACHAGSPVDLPCTASWDGVVQFGIWNPHQQLRACRRCRQWPAGWRPRRAGDAQLRREAHRGAQRAADDLDPENGARRVGCEHGDDLRGRACPGSRRSAGHSRRSTGRRRRAAPSILTRKRRRWLIELEVPGLAQRDDHHEHQRHAAHQRRGHEPGREPGGIIRTRGICHLRRSSRHRVRSAAVTSATTGYTRRLSRHLARLGAQRSPTGTRRTG